VDIGDRVDAGELTTRLAEMGARLMMDTLPSYLNDSLRPVSQSDEGSTYASKITAQDRPINIDATPDVFVNHVRGLSPIPGATVAIDGKHHKVLKARVSARWAQPGVWALIEGAVVVGVKDGSVEIETLQPPGKKPQSARDWVRGRRIESGRVG
jgi:methionyl-tRNA formyltransferase